jgi:hypothetical protein
MRLADLGARVIKIERPGVGDIGRTLAFAGKSADGDTISFHAMNRNKESVAADLKDADDLAWVKHLVTKADVIIQNFRPGVMERIGLDYESVRALNPALVYASATGYGDTGPWKDRPGQDLLAQSVSGMLWLSGSRDDGPVPVGLSIADHLMSCHIAQGVTALLVRRFRTGLASIPFGTAPGLVDLDGYRAELLPVICEIYLAARQGGSLPPNQQHIARQAEVIVRGLATVGIIALVDEATGYQEIRTKDALSRILEAFVAKELQPWVRTFPNDFYRELFRLRDIAYDPASVQRPLYFANLTNDIIYDRLAPGVRDELKKAQKKAVRSGMFQHLTSNIGYPKLREHLGSVVTLMKLSGNWGEFYNHLDLIHPSYRKNMPAPLWLDDKDFGF